MMMSDIEFKSYQALERNSYSNTVPEQMISSSIGSVFTSLLVTPFDVVKTRLQIQERSETFKNGTNSLIELRQYEKILSKVNRTTFKGTIDAFIQIPKQEGLRSLWSGLVPTLMISVPANVMYFTMYDQYRQKLISNNIVPLGFIPIVAGVSARIMTVTLVGPIEFLRTKVQSEKVNYSNTLSTLRNLVKQRGFISLWHGWVPTIYRDVSFSALYWSIYERLKQHNPDPKFLESFSYGAISGTVAATLTLPFDVIKTLRQSELGKKNIVTGFKSPSTWRLLVALYMKGGVKSLFAGIFPRILKVGPACAIMISSYEAGKLYFRKNPIMPSDEDGN